MSNISLIKLMEHLPDRYKDGKKSTQAFRIRPITQSRDQDFIKFADSNNRTFVLPAHILPYELTDNPKMKEVRLHNKGENGKPDLEVEIIERQEHFDTRLDRQGVSNE